MIDIVGPLQTSAAAGGAGVATGTVTTPIEIMGKVIAYHVEYKDAPPAGTTDLTIATAGVNHPAMTIASITDGATDGWRFPATAKNLNTTGAAIANEYVDGVPIKDKITVTMAQANNNDYAIVYLLVEVDG